MIECVPNISLAGEGDSLANFVRAIESVSGVSLLHLDSDISANRTVVTFVAQPQAVLEAAYLLVKTACSEIDMRRHRGAHPRMGALDVLPFVPLAGSKMETCIELAKRLGARVAADFAIPVFLYEEAASSGERINLANIRRGEFEGLSEKLKQPEWKPDFGPEEPHQSFGAIAIGARKILTAYNVCLNTQDVSLARAIAKEIRKMEAVKAIGWYLPHFSCAQVSCNLTDFEITGLWEVFEACKRLAKERGLLVTGSEIVGLLARDALLQAGQHYSDGSPEEQMSCAVKELGLSFLKSFKVEEHVIECLNC